MFEYVILNKNAQGDESCASKGKKGCSMDLINLETAQNKRIGIKQSLKTIKNDQAEALFIAKDAEQYVVRNVVKLAEEKQLPVIYIESMLILGKACNIDVGAATAVIVK